jgi:hypothetical protein
MMRKQFGVLAVALCAAASAAKADETGLAGIHTIAYERGGKACMTEHFHDGSGNGSTRKAAEAAAKESWMSFTAFEYGSDWGSYNLAAAKTMQCSEAGGNSWSCFTSARPCRRAAKPGHSPRSASR